MSTALVVVAVALATAARWGLGLWVGDQFPFLTFFVAVALVTWFAGRLAGLFTLILSGGTVLYFFLAPRFSFSLAEPGTPEGLLLYLLAGAVIILLFDTRRQAWLSAVNQAELLQVTLSSIGDGVILTAQSAVSHDIPAGKMISGSPGFDNRVWLRAVTIFQRLPELLKRLDRVEKKLRAQEPAEDSAKETGEKQ